MSWCPNCKTEYKEGITVCSDCDAELVESLETEERCSILFGEENQIELLKKFLEYNDIMSCVISQIPEGDAYTYELSVSKEDEELSKRATVVFFLQNTCHTISFQKQNK